VFAVTDGWPNLPPAVQLENEPAKDQRFKIGPPPTGRDRVEDGDWWGCASELNRLAHLDNRQRWKDLMAAAARANVSFYPIAPNGLAAFDVGAVSERPGEALGAEGNYRMMQTRVQSMVDLATNTDGIAIVNRNDTGVAMTRIIDDISAYYLLGYYSTNEKQDGRFRKIEVKLKQPGLTIHARRGYVAQALADGRPATAPGRSTTAAAPSSAQPAVDAALSALTQVRPSTTLFIDGSADGGELTLTVELATSESDTPAWRSGGTVAFTVQAGTESIGSVTATIEPGARAARASLAVTGAGPFVVRARATAGDHRVDSDQVVVTPREASPLRSPLLFRAAVSPRAPLKPMADRQVRRTERLHVEWPLAGAVEQREVRLLDRRGQPLAIGPTITERDVDGRPALGADLTLAPLAEGDYVLEARVTSGGQTAQSWVAFRVVR
jgi:hypothetical protein